MAQVEGVGICRAMVDACITQQERLAESQAIGIKHVVGIVVYLDIAVAIILRTRRAQSARKEDFLEDEVIALYRQPCLHLNLLTMTGHLHVLCLATQDSLHLVFLAIRILGQISDMGGIHTIIQSLHQVDRREVGIGRSPARGQIGQLPCLIHNRQPFHSRRRFYPQFHMGMRDIRILLRACSEQSDGYDSYAREHQHEISLNLHFFFYLIILYRELCSYQIVNPASTPK